MQATGTPKTASTVSMSPQGWTWLPSFLRVDTPLLKGMSWRRVVWLFGVAAGFAVWSTPSMFIYGDRWSTVNAIDLSLAFSNWIVRYLINFAPMLIVLTIADNVPVTGTKRTATLIIAMVLGAQIQWPLLCAWQPEFANSVCVDFLSSPWQSWKEMLAENTILTITSSTLIALVYFYRKRARRVAQALHRAEIARADVERKTLEADLQTMQARVEPAFLFETLGSIGELFERDPATGERMLDELIRYLRAALPDMRAMRSTLKQEAVLVRAYLEILRIRVHGRIDFHIDVPAHAESAVVPPMLLLPLLEAVLGPADTADSTSIRLDADRDPSRVRIDLVGRGPALRAVDPSVVRGLRERLLGACGEQATLAVGIDPGRQMTAILEIPHANA